MSVICLDFDGVLHDPTNRDEGFRMGKPVEGALHAVEKLLRAGHTLVIHSCRARYASDRDHVQAWLAYFHFPPIHVVYTKPPADVYIDDRAVRFEEPDDLDQRAGYTAWDCTMVKLRMLGLTIGAPRANALGLQHGTQR